jgi:hypothetical protein
MPMFAAALFALVQAAASPAAAPVPVSPERADARCLAAFGMLATDTKADVQRASQMGALFFYGKLVGRNPRVDLKAVMLDAAQTVGPRIQGELQRCGGELQRSGEAMQAVGTALVGSAPAAKPTPEPSATPTARSRR